MYTDGMNFVDLELQDFTCFSTKFRQNILCVDN